MNILTIHGHPEADSFGAALADAFVEGGRSAGHDVRVLSLRDLDFDPVLRHRSKRFEDVEPDILAARASITWADHIMIQYPTWWASTPALLKGFIDRTFVPGFAYQYRDGKSGWDKLLTGKTGSLLVTMDAPSIGDWILYFGASRRAVKVGVLWFCGIKPTKVATFAPIKGSTDAKRTAWLEKARDMGARAT